MYVEMLLYHDTGILCVCLVLMMTISGWNWSTKWISLCIHTTCWWSVLLVLYRCNRRGLQVLYSSVRPSTKFSGFFSAMCAAIALKLCTWFYMYDLQIKFEDGCYWPIFRRVMLLEGFYSFPDFSSLCLQIFIRYLVHCFAIPRYRSSLSLVLIHWWFFTKLWPLDLEKK
jgi:hypothetical protein